MTFKVHTRYRVFEIDKPWLMEFPADEYGFHRSDCGSCKHHTKQSGEPPCDTCRNKVFAGFPTGFEPLDEEDSDGF